MNGRKLDHNYSECMSPHVSTKGIKNPFHEKEITDRILTYADNNTDHYIFFGKDFGCRFWEPKLLNEDENARFTKQVRKI
jgi:hypothetical protein